MVHLLAKLYPFFFVSTVFASSSPACHSYEGYVLIPNTDFNGHDLRSFPAYGAEDCVPACAKDPKCKSFTFSPINSLCLLKTGTYEQYSPNHFAGAESGYPCFAPDCVIQKDFVFFRNRDLYGNDVRMTKAKDYETCFSNCAKAHDCYAATFNDNNSICFFKKAESYKYRFSPFKNAWSGYQCGNRALVVGYIKELMKENKVETNKLVNEGMLDIAKTLPNPNLPQFKFDKGGITFSMELSKLSGINSLDIDIVDFNLDSTPTGDSVYMYASMALKESVYFELKGPVTVSGAGSWIGVGGTYECGISAHIAKISGKATAVLDMSSEGKGLQFVANVNAVDFSVPAPYSPSFVCRGNNWLADRIVSGLGQVVFSAASFFTQGFGDIIPNSIKRLFLNIVNKQLTKIAPSLMFAKFDQWLYASTI